MRRFNRLNLLILLAVGLAAVLPVFAALGFARHEAAAQQRAYVTNLAKKTLAESERVGDQVANGAKIMSALPEDSGCTAQRLALMRQIDLSSTLLQAVGHVTDANVIDCSSVGDRQTFALGTPQIVSSHGARIWTNVRVFDSDQTYLAIARGPFIGIIHKALPLEFVEDIPGLGIASFNMSNRKILVERGQIPVGWMTAGNMGDGYFRHDGNLVAVIASHRYDLGAVAAVPASNMTRFSNDLVYFLIPLGALVGFLLAAFVIFVVRSRLSMPGMIRAALKAKEFHLAYQPVIDLSTGAILGAEALIRWRRPDGEIIPPDHFIGVAEQAGVIQLITARVLELLADDVRYVTRIAPHFHFAVNFAAADIHDNDLCEDISRFCARSGLPASQLVVEATERSFVDMARANAMLQRIRALGTQVAVDDFGTGYSSLGYLARLEIDMLKIDKLFIDALGTGSASGEVAERIIAMAKALKLAVVAEGVETAEQAARLRELGVEYAQGFLFDRPLALEDLMQRLRAQKRPELAVQAKKQLAA